MQTQMKFLLRRKKKTTNYNCACDWGNSREDAYYVFINKFNHDEPPKVNIY